MTAVTTDQSASTRELVRTGAIAAAIAAVVTTGLAIAAGAADASLEVDSAAIPIAAFTWWTLVGAAIGIATARLIGHRRRFVIATVTATAVSLVPAVAMPDDTATKVVLVAAHVLAAAIIVPPLARRLPH